MSKLEDKVASILKKEQREYGFAWKKEQVFQDLKRKQPLRFDFAIYRSCGLVALIEVDGEQHFHQIKHFQKTQREFQKTQEHDRIKNSYCLAHQIPLFRIPYTEIDNVNSLSDILSEKYRVRSKWHNDMLKI